MFTLFASTCPNISDPINDLIGNWALDLNQVSGSCCYDVPTLSEALLVFQKSKTYIDFYNAHTVRIYTYLLLDNARVKRVD